MFGYKAQIIILFLASLLTACAGTKTGNEGRYQIAQDLAPDRLPLAQEMIDPTPIYEPPSRGGNRDYRVLGKDYKVLKSIEGFVEHGIASWYGKKFHGHLTSNGETYNMFDMSAAHKNLPLPTYVKVTNLDNGKQAVVRVNDRGPFHPGRIIDLSYAAAYKLGVTASGTANVKIEALHSSAGIYIAVESHQDAAVLNAKSPAIAALYQLPTKVKKADVNYQLIAGPIANHDEAEKIVSTLHNSGYQNAKIINSARN